MKNCRLIEINPYYHYETDSWTFSLKYEYTDKFGSVYHGIIPKVQNPFFEHNPIIDITTNYAEEPFKDLSINLRDEVKVYLDKNGNYCYVNCIKKAPPKEMTIAEIEKQLGYEIKIVKDKEEDNKR